jgi:hypothetical protein
MKTCQKGPRKEKDPEGSHYRNTLKSIKDRYNTEIAGTKEYYKSKMKNVQDAQRRTLALIREEFKTERKNLKTAHKAALKIAIKEGHDRMFAELIQYFVALGDLRALESQRMALRKIQYQQEMTNWKNTLNKAIAPLLKSCAGELAQYKAAVKQDPESFVYPNAHISDCLNCLPCTPSCKDSLLSIAFTSQQMQVLEYQALSVHESLCAAPSPCCKDVEFWWQILSGGGELDKSYGQTVIYHAPAFNANCSENAVIGLTDCCGRSTTLALIVNAVTDPNQVAYKSWTPDADEDCYQVPGPTCLWHCAIVWIDGFTCDGEFVSHDFNCTCGGSGIWGGACSDEWCAARMASCFCHSQAAAAAACGYSLPVDVRTDDQKALGCCPAALFIG